jgi:hypothetical protein
MIRIAMITALLVGNRSLAHAQQSNAPAAPPETSSADPLVRVMQLDADGKPIGAPQEMRCPSRGCQLASVLRIGQITTPLQTVVTFAGQGVYVVLESPNTGAQVHLYGDPRPAPLFLPKSTGNLGRLVHIVVDQPSSGGPVPRLATLPRVATTQDTWLRIEINENASTSKPAGS